MPLGAGSIGQPNGIHPTGTAVISLWPDSRPSLGRDGHFAEVEVFATEDHGVDGAT